MSDHVIHVTDASYQQDVIESNLPVLVDFWAPWCGPCRIIGPVVEQLADEYAGRLTVAKVNTDENRATPGSLGIRGIPTLILYAGGQEVERVVGVRPKQDLVARIDALLAKPQS
jgi:thioredoxin 1